MDGIRIQCEFEVRTPLGRATGCKVEMTIRRNYTDEETVKGVVAWCKKALKSETIQHPCIDFIMDDGTVYGKGTSRVYDWFGQYNMVKWDGHNGTDVCENITVTAKTLRDLYLECVDRMQKEERMGA